MTRRFRGIFILWVVFRHGLDERRGRGGGKQQGGDERQHGHYRRLVSRCSIWSAVWMTLELSS